MAKTKQEIKLQKRDWVTTILLLAVIGTNWLWYQSSQDLSKQLENANLNNHHAWIQINKLRACHNENIQPCDATPLQ